MLLLTASMLQQQKCLETHCDKRKRKSTKYSANHLGNYGTLLIDENRNYTNVRLDKALTCLVEEKRTARQHVATNSPLQLDSIPQVTKAVPIEPQTATNTQTGITAKLPKLNTQLNVSSNIQNVETHIKLNADISVEQQVIEAQSKPIEVANNECLVRVGSMLPQHDAIERNKKGNQTNIATQNTAAATAVTHNDVKRCEGLTATTNTNSTTTITTTTITTSREIMFENGAVENEELKETIDYNSRRRRGRLRPPPTPTPRSTLRPMPQPMHAVHVCGDGECRNVYGNGIAAGVCRFLMWLAGYLEKIANARCDKNDPLLYLLSLLLSLIVVNVNRIANLVNEFKCEIDKNEIEIDSTNTITDITQNTPKYNNNNNNDNSNSKINDRMSAIAFLENSAPMLDSTATTEDDDAENDSVVPKCTVVKVKNNKSVALISPTAVVIAADIKVETNLNKRINTNSLSNTSIASSQQTMHEIIPKRRKPLLAITWRFNPMKLIFFYAFILCTSILLPCGNNLVSAAKPKSATQLQQQKQLQQQQMLEQQQKLNEQQQQQHQPHQHEHAPGHQAHQPVVGINGVAASPGLGIPVAAGGDWTPPTYQVVSSKTSNDDMEFIFPAEQSDEQLFDEEEENLNIVELEEDEDEQDRVYNLHNNETTHPNVTKAPLFPTDLFTKEQLENGAVICHIIGVIYMFVALAIVCDEFFVPSLDVIIEKLDITDDVAGATFMAAGGSAPELFTSVIGVFISFDDVGIGTIVGSAVFNILFVIGMCALFSKTVLELTWWPLFRDCSFYSISLMVLIYFFRDNFIYWWEALILFSIYIAYVAFMKWNVQVERFVKRLITKNKVTRVRSTDQLMPAGNAANSSDTSMATQPGGSVTSRAASETRSGPPGSSSGAGAKGNSSGGTAGSTHTGAKFRHGLLQLMIHTIDPLHDGKVDEKATQLHAIASLKVLLDATKPQRGGATTSAANHVKINLKETTLADRPNGNIDTTLDSPSILSQSGRRQSWIDQRVKIQTRKFSIKTNEIEDEPEPLSMAWPDTARKRLTYILVAPLLIPMWLTLPDTRTPRGKKYYPVTFIGSIVWIAAFSYLMVWWANVAGDTARIPPEVMGLTFLAAGTSIPDLITSVIVARKGFGDMAVSSSVGSNIFDVTVGLPIPWLIYGIIYGAPVEVNSVGMVCSITILFMMLIFVVMSIACFRWKMNKGLGFTMFLLYFVFVAVSLMFEYDTLRCPV